MSMGNTTAEEHQEELTIESRQAYFGGNWFNGNGNALSNNPMMYSNVANQRLINVQNGIHSSSWMNNGGGYYSDQALSKRRFSNNMGRYANMGSGETDYPTGIGGLGNAGGATGAAGDDLNGLNGAFTSTGADQTQSQDYIDTYKQIAANSFPSGSGMRQNGIGGGGQSTSLAGGGTMHLNNNLLVGSRRPFAANRRNGLGYGVGGLGIGAAAGLTGYPSAYGQGANQGIGQLQPAAGIRSSGYGGGSGYGGYAPVSVISGYGQAPTECETGLNPLLTLLTIAGAAVGFYLIMNKLTKGGGLFGGIGRKFQQEQHEKDLTDTNNFFDDVVDQFWIGLEEFENKVDRIAQEGENSEDDSWLGRIYHQFKHLMKDEDGSEPDPYNMEGLEPPMFDDTWGLADDFDVMMKNGNVLTGKTNVSSTFSPPLGERGNNLGVDSFNRSKRNASYVGQNETLSNWNRTFKIDEMEYEQVIKDPEDDDSNMIEDMLGFDPINFVPGFILGYDGAETKCQKGFMRCVSGSLFKGGIEHSNDPEGISGYLRKVFFRIGFKGGFGNVWKALMDVPEARKIKRCMNKRDDCLSHEILKSSLNHNQWNKDIDGLDNEFENGSFLRNMTLIREDHNNTNTINNPDAKSEDRLLINPEYAESMDTSDGSEMFSPEDRKIEEEQTRIN